MLFRSCRRAFPCWDEPDFKAVFSTALTVDANMLAISNAPEESSRILDGGRREIRFADTMPMSTYLVAFIVGLWFVYRSFYGMRIDSGKH